MRPVPNLRITSINLHKHTVAPHINQLLIILFQYHTPTQLLLIIPFQYHTSIPVPHTNPAADHSIPVPHTNPAAHHTIPVPHTNPALIIPFQYHTPTQLLIIIPTQQNLTVTQTQTHPTSTEAKKPVQHSSFWQPSPDSVPRSLKIWQFQPKVSF